MRRTMMAAAVALVVLTGCSSGGSKQASSGSSTPTTTAAASGPTTTIRPVNTSFTGANSAQFCALAKTYNDSSASRNTATTPAQLKAVTQAGQTAINQAVTAAPAEIKPDVQVLSDAFNTLFTALNQVNFDATKLSASSLTALQTPEFQASTVRFQAYLKSVCGIGG